MSVTVEIEARAVSWNMFWSGKNHWSRTKLKNEWRLRTLAALPGAKMFRKPVHIHVWAEFKRAPVDPDNICAKLFIDPMKGRLLKDDDAGSVVSVTLQSYKGSRDHITIEIEEIGAASPG